MKKVYFIFLLLLVNVFFSCKNSDLIIVEDKDDVGYNLFNSNNIGSTEVYFFDDDNIVNEDGTSYIRPKTKGTSSIKSSDCYMIKNGNIEILVDCGYQSGTYGSVNSKFTFYEQTISDNFVQNLGKKIASLISDDGVLDYLIVTHADFDHIASLIVNGGLFDYFYNDKEIEAINGKKVKFTKIKNIIDFDSGLVKKFSDSSIYKKSRLVSSDYYQAYVYQRNRLIDEDETNYVPASSLFYVDDFNKEERYEGMPDAIIKRLEKVNSNNSTIEYILNENTANRGAEGTLKNIDFLDNVFKLNGKLKMNEKKRYFEIPINKAKLWILYNWHYDYIYRSNFNEGSLDDSGYTDGYENTYDSQDANNISVCFEVVDGKFKFASFGDLGGNGENGLIKYYKGTELLSNVTCFKSSHHGSTTNKENSEELFNIMNPKIIIVTGCAQYKPTEADDPVNSSMVGTPKIKQYFFDNIRNGTKSSPYVLCTNINSFRYDNDKAYFESTPFYGDIRVRFNKKEVGIAYSFIGEIKPYLSRSLNSNYANTFNHELTFYTRNKNNSYKSVYQTEWFENIGYSYGE